MKNINIILLLSLFILMLTLSCIKEPQIYSRKQLELLNAKLYCIDTLKNNLKIYPHYSATVNDTAIFINVYNKDINNSNKFHFSIVSENKGIGKTNFNYFNFTNGIDKNWIVYNNFSNSIYINYKHDNSYLDITDINKTNKTITGKFIVDNIKGYFTDLPYSNTLDSLYIFNSIKFEVEDTNDTYFSGKYYSNEVQYTNNYFTDFNINFYYDINFRIIIPSNVNHNETYHLDNNNTCYFGYNNEYKIITYGTYTISNYQMYNHTYKKYNFDITLNDNYNKTIKIKNAELIVY